MTLTRGRVVVWISILLLTIGKYTEILLLLILGRFVFPSLGNHLVIMFLPEFLSSFLDKSMNFGA